MEISLILPGRGQSGGIRVTMEMANALLHRGHKVRILVYSPPIGLFPAVYNQARRCYRKTFFHNIDWLDFFNGEIISFGRLEDIEFRQGEIVIAVGVYFVPELLELNKPVIKLQYCHGLPGDKLNPLYEYLKYSIPTISVSQAIVPTLEREASMKVLGVVPNGIDLKQYYILPEIKRDGLGIIYGSEYEKAPQETLHLMQQLKTQIPDKPQYIFGKIRRPRQISPHTYWRLPSVPKARELYNRSLIWFVASRNEGFCLPILEAMACGCIVISSNHDNASSLISHGKNGFIVEFNDIEAYLRCARLVLNDIHLARNIVKKAQQTVKEYTWDKAAGKMEFYLSSISSSQAGTF